MGLADLLTPPPGAPVNPSVPFTLDELREGQHPGITLQSPSQNELQGMLRWFHHGGGFHTHGFDSLGPHDYYLNEEVKRGFMPGLRWKLDENTFPDPSLFYHRERLGWDLQNYPWTDKTYIDPFSQPYTPPPPGLYEVMRPLPRGNRQDLPSNHEMVLDDHSGQGHGYSHWHDHGKTSRWTMEPTWQIDGNPIPRARWQQEREFSGLSTEGGPIDGPYTVPAPQWWEDFFPR